MGFTLIASSIQSMHHTPHDHCTHGRPYEKFTSHGGFSRGASYFSRISMGCFAPHGSLQSQIQREFSCDMEFAAAESMGLPSHTIHRLYDYMGVSVGFQQISCEFPWNALPWRISWNFHGIARGMYCVTYHMERSTGFRWHICDLMDSMHPQLFFGICHGMVHGKARQCD